MLFWWLAGKDGAPKRKASLPANRLQLAACAAATFGAAGAYWFLVALGSIFMHLVTLLCAKTIPYVLPWRMSPTMGLPPWNFL